MSEDHTNNKPSAALLKMAESCYVPYGAHKPAVNESVSPSRTRGSLPASPGQIEVEAAAVQLAPVLCPPEPLL